MKNDRKVRDVRSRACKIKVLNGRVPGTWKWTIGIGCLSIVLDVDKSKTLFAHILWWRHVTIKNDRQVHVNIDTTLLVMAHNPAHDLFSIGNLKYYLELC